MRTVGLIVSNHTLELPHSIHQLPEGVRARVGQDGDVSFLTGAPQDYRPMSGVVSRMPTDVEKGAVLVRARLSNQASQHTLT